MKVTYYGHSCFGIQTEKDHLLFDPFISGNELASHISVDSLNPDYLLITHGHQDHILDAMSIARRTGAIVVGVFEVCMWFGNQGHEHIFPMNTGGVTHFDFGRVKLVNAVHSSSFPDGSYAGVPVGFVIEADGQTFYYAGDTALHTDMKLIGESYNLDFAILPIGSVFTMDAHDAIKAADLIQCNNIIGMHYDTFEPIRIDHEATRSLFSSAGKKLHLMNIGETRDF